MTHFENLELPDFLMKSLHLMGIKTPTPIQANAIPPGLTGQDILASAQTGTGKTIAYLIPLITRLITAPGDTVLILTPTRELAMQVKETVEKLVYKEIRNPVALLIGGDPMRKQLDMLKKNPPFVIGTPGRINDHLSRNSLKLQKTRFFVIDEADRMLDMGFEEDLENIIQELPEDRQTFMFSATLPINIIKLSKKYLNNPNHISLGSSTQPAPQVNQQMVQTTVSDKFSCLLKELETREGSTIIFVKTKVGAENLADKLKRENLQFEIIPGNLRTRRVGAIHGDLRQSKRNQVLSAFRDKKLDILVATDVAARGLDVPHIELVVNYDPPQDPESYIHRIGRTGRAGSEGEAVSLLLPSERHIWRKINDFMNQKSGDHPSNESYQKRGRGKSSGSSSRGRASGGFESEGRRFGGGASRPEGRRFGGASRSEGGRFANSASQSEGRRFAGGGSQFEGRRFAGGASQSEGRRFAGGSSQSEGRRFAGGASQSEGRRFAGGASQSEGRRFAGGASQSEGRRFAGGTSQSEGRRFAGGASQSEGRRFAGGASQSEGRRFAGGASQSEGRRFAGGASQSEGRRFAGGASQSEGRRFAGGGSQSEGRRFAGGASRTEGRRFAGSTSRTEGGRTAPRSVRGSRATGAPSISYKPKSESGYGSRRRTQTEVS